MLDRSDLLTFVQDCQLQAYALDGSQIEPWVQVIFTYWLLRGLPSSTPAPLVPPRGLDNPGEQLKTLHRMAAQRSALSRALGIGQRDDLEAATAVAFEIALLLHVSGWGGPDYEPAAVDKAFDEFVSAASPVATSYRAYRMWQQLRRYSAWAKIIGTPGYPTAESMARTYRQRLESMAVRRYWGPRP